VNSPAGRKVGEGEGKKLQLVKKTHILNERGGAQTKQGGKEKKELAPLQLCGAGSGKAKTTGVCFSGQGPPRRGRDTLSGRSRIFDLENRLEGAVVR